MWTFYIHQLFLFFIFCSHSVGFFTAPVKGVYNLQFTVFGYNAGSTGVHVYKNNQRIMGNWESNNDDRVPEFFTNSLVLELTAGDEIHLVLPSGYSIYDDSNNYSTFSGSLLFTLWGCCSGCCVTDLSQTLLLLAELWIFIKCWYISALLPPGQLSVHSLHVSNNVILNLTSLLCRHMKTILNKSKLHSSVWILFVIIDCWLWSLRWVL